MKLHKLTQLLFWLNITMICACQTSTNQPTVTNELATPIYVDEIPRATPPSTLDFVNYDDPVDLSITWAWDEYTTAAFFLYEDGFFNFGNINARGMHNGQRGTLSSEELDTINRYKESLELEPLPPNLDGNLAVSVHFDNPMTFTFTCGNRNCPVVLRDMIWYIVTQIDGIPRSPFNDEDQILAGKTQLALFAWYTDFKTPPYILSIRESRLLELYQAHSLQRIHYDYWEITEAEMAEVVSCTNLLKNAKQTTTGNDLEVIKFNYWSDDPKPLIRLSKTEPPDCLPDMMDLLQESLLRERPQAVLTILPFD